MNKIIVGQNIVKTFGEGAEKRNVLDGVSVEINTGEFVAVMGPSGSGKSTLLYALSGMDGIDSGSVLFDGVDLARLGDNELADVRRRKMGFVFQQPTLLRNLNVLDNIVLPATRDGRKNARQLSAKARALMARTDIKDLADRDITQASGGQLQRVGICRALMNDPQIIFGDEPTGALNSPRPTRSWRCWPTSTAPARRSCWSPMTPGWQRRRSGCCSSSTARSPASTGPAPTMKAAATSKFGKKASRPGWPR